jgi:ribose-phosphate pyrophosphokinase
MQVLGFPDYGIQAHALAVALNAPYEIIDLHHFPDGESRLRLPRQLPDHVIICRSLDRGNDKLVELLLAAKCARTLGANYLTLVAPYLCYMRQDKAFQPGEAVSQRIIGRFLAGLFDALITVDPHLHRIRSLAEAVPVKPAIALSAAPAMGEFLAAQPGRPLLVGPDQESEQWVQAVAAPAELRYVVAQKTRHGDRNVEIQMPEYDYAGLDVVLVDDVASTGYTLAAATHALRKAGARRIDVLVTHAIFAGNALDILKTAGVRDIWSSDSVTHPSNAFVLAPILSGAVIDAVSLPRKTTT